MLTESQNKAVDESVEGAFGDIQNLSKPDAIVVAAALGEIFRVMGDLPPHLIRIVEEKITLGINESRRLAAQFQKETEGNE